MTDRVDITPLVTEANPVPDPVAIADEFDIRASLLAAIDERSEHMAHTTQDNRASGSRPHDRQGWRRPVLVFAGMAMLLIVVIGAAVLLFGGGDEPIADTAPSTTEAAPTTPSTLDVESLAWARVPDDEAAFHPADDVDMVDVAAWGGGFVAVGGTETPVPFESWDPEIEGRGASGADAAVWLSPDGVNWTMVPNSEAPLGGLPGSQHINSVAVGGPGLVAVGSTMDDPEMLPRVEPSDYPFFEPASYPFVSAVWTSEDGVNWTKSAAAFGSMNAVVRGGPGLVAVGRDRWYPAVWTSPDGIAWTRVSHDPETFGYGEMRQVVAGASGLVAVGDQDGTAAVWTSPDGLTWTLHQGIHSEYNRGAGIDAVTATPDGFVGVGTEETSENACHDGASGDCRAMVWTSPDGITWTRVPHDESIFGGGPDKQMMRDVTTVGDHIVAVGTSVWTSPDGYTWTRVYQDPALTGEHQGSMNAVAANDTMIVIVGDDGASETKLIELPDGDEAEHWTSTASAIVWLGTAQQSD